VLFEGGFVRPVLAVFDQPASSSDGGALLLKLADVRLGLTRAVAGALPDARAAGKVRHSLVSVVQQRVFGIGNGYEDANDAARLRSDPTHQLLLGRCPEAGRELASQPTISRLENAFDAAQVKAASRAFSGAVLKRHQRRLRGKVGRVIIDVDATWDDAHGEQQGALFNGFYRNHGFLPLLAFVQFDSEREQYLMVALLRPGNAANGNVLSFLTGVIEQVRERFPKAVLIVRADAGFALPEVLEYLDDHKVRLISAGWLPQDRFSAGVVRWSNIERGPVSGAHSGFARYSMALPSPVEPRVETKIVTVTPGLCGHHGK